MSSPLHAGLEAHFAALEKFLAAQELVFEPEVRPMVRDVLAHPGKRLRPLLAFSSGAGGPPPDALVRGAGIIELVHLATLVHDDVLDGADTRHGSDTPNRTHGAHAAVLFGDALFAHALVLAADHPTPELCRIVARASREVCSGEVCQTFSRGNDRLSLDDYYRHIRLKTAELFEGACRVGALLADRPEAEATDTVTLAGKHCESGDVLLKDLALPPATTGDVLAVFATGAYNASMSSNYNRIPRPAAVLVHEGVSELVQRREQPEELLRYDVLPERLRSVI